MSSQGANPGGRPAISAVLPAFNEALALEAVTRDLSRVLARLCSSHEIVIVDDGSSDDTPRLADQLAASIPAVIVVHHPQNRGYGAALRSGFGRAGLDWIFFTDADGQFRLEELERLVALCPDHALVVGYRERRNDPLARRAYGKVFSFLVRALFGVKARDINCAFKLFRRELAAAGLGSEGALINAELLAAARRQGVDPVEVPVSHLPRRFGRATGGSPRVILRAAGELVALWWRSKK